MTHYEIFKEFSLLQTMSVHPSVVDIDSGHASSPSCAGTMSEGGHAAHDGSCLFSKSVEFISCCAFGPKSGDPLCRICASWPEGKRAAYRSSLLRLAKVSNLNKPQCWSRSLDLALGLKPSTIPSPAQTATSSASSQLNQDFISRLQSPGVLQMLQMLQDPVVQQGWRT